MNCLGQLLTPHLSILTKPPARGETSGAKRPKRLSSWPINLKCVSHGPTQCPLSPVLLFPSSDEFKGHSLLQAAREADMAKVKKTLALEIINFKHPQTHETALVRSGCSSLPAQSADNMRINIRMYLKRFDASWPWRSPAPASPGNSAAAARPLDTKTFYLHTYFLLVIYYCAQRRAVAPPLFHALFFLQVVRYHHTTWRVCVYDFSLKHHVQHLASWFL